MAPHATKVHNFNPDGFPPFVPTYSHISEVNISPTTKMVSIAGQVGVSRDGSVNVPFAEQVRGALENVDTCLAAAGADKSCIISFRQYVVHALSRGPEDLKIRGEVFTKWWKSTEGENPPPSSTLVGIDSLARKDADYEIEVTCIVSI